jgi:hypothetical protein
VAVDSSGQVFCTGTAADPAFGPLYFENDSIMASYGSEVFVAGYDSNGHFLCAVTAGGTSGDLGQGIASSAGGDIYIAGAFTETARFGTIALQGNGPISSSGFLARMESIPSHVTEEHANDPGSLSLYPNPARGIFFLRGLSSPRYSCAVTVSDLLGHTVYHHEFSPASFEDAIRCDLGSPRPGIYFVRVAVDGSIYHGKVVVE